MVDRGGDIDMIHDVLQCNKAMKQGKTRPKLRTRRSSSEPPCTEFQIKDLIWSRLMCDMKSSWIQESTDNKEMVIAQFVAESKATDPVTKNRNLYTVYQIELKDSDGYNSDFTANSESIFQFNASSTMFNATVDNNGNGKILEGTDLNVKAATAARKSRTSILRGKGKK